MRDLTDKEIKIVLFKATCLFCEAQHLYNGPQGGMMTNVYCADCGAAYNLPPANIVIGAQLINGPTKPIPPKPARLKLKPDLSGLDLWWKRLWRWRPFK